MTSLLCLFRVIRKCCLNSINVDSPKSGRRMQKKSYCLTALDGRLIRGLSASMCISTVRSINEQYACMTTIAHGSVRGARIRISVNSFCLLSRPHVEKCDSHYPSDSSEAVDLRYCSPLQPRKPKVVLGIGRARFPPSH